MKDVDENSFEEIDNFKIAISVSSGNQEEVFKGNRGIANITLSYDVICMEPNACTTTATSSELIGISKDNTKVKINVTEQLTVVNIFRSSLLHTFKCQTCNARSFRFMLLSFCTLLCKRARHRHAHMQTYIHTHICPYQSLLTLFPSHQSPQTLNSNKHANSNQQEHLLTAHR